MAWALLGFALRNRSTIPGGEMRTTHSLFGGVGSFDSGCCSGFAGLRPRAGFGDRDFSLEQRKQAFRAHAALLRRNGGGVCRPVAVAKADPPGPLMPDGILQFGIRKGGGSLARRPLRDCLKSAGSRAKAEKADRQSSERRASPGRAVRSEQRRMAAFPAFARKGCASILFPPFPFSTRLPGVFRQSLIPIPEKSGIWEPVDAGDRVPPAGSPRGGTPSPASARFHRPSFSNPGRGGPRPSRMGLNGRLDFGNPSECESKRDFQIASGPRTSLRQKFTTGPS